VIRKLVIANRGEVARRVVRTCRAMGIATVAVYSDPDADAPFVAEADEAVGLGGATPAESYLRGDAIVEAAERTGADAVHPGYGFLAESADFARACRKHGLVFVGPPSEAIAAMGDKLEAKQLAAAAGVPVLPGVEVTGAEGAALRAAADRVGWPVLVKAALGGGGVGMRVVREPAELAEAVAAARRQAGAAFAGDAIFLERHLDRARHVEVQILGDAHGRVVHLFERECSIQRRHQKLVEECPSSAVDDQLRARLAAAAVALGEAIGYVGAGTVEFLLTPEREFVFLEVNTRLQVEHPVTEAVTGLDLVRLQLLLAAGEPLPDEVVRATVSGHAVEARLYAEDPRRGFLPAAGRLHRFRVDDRPGLRVDTGVADGSVVGVHYDPLLAKVVAHAPTRAEAAGLLAAALAAARLHGLVTNRDLLVRVLRHPEFLAGEADTQFLERHPVAELAAPLADAPAERLSAAAAALAAQAARRSAAPVLAGVPSGWRNNPSQPQRVVFDGEHGEVEVAYRFGRGGLDLDLDGEPVAGVRLWACLPDLVDLETAGVRRRFQVHRAGAEHFVDSALGPVALRERPRFPAAATALERGSLTAPLPGVVRQVAALPGERVEAGAVLVVVEAMKTEHRVAAPHAGQVREVLVAEGQQIDAGMVLAVVDGDGVDEAAPPPGAGADHDASPTAERRE
jgi:acetyl/propionyl-CoA carboxylase alpha subunit